MPARIVPFGLTRPVALERIRFLMSQGAYDFDPHFSDMMVERDISMRQVLTVLREGTINQGPELDEYNDWRCRVKKRVAGRLVRVVVAIQRNALLIVTTF